MNEKEKTIKVYPKTGKPYKVTIPFDEDAGYKQIDAWITEHLKLTNFVQWEWANEISVEKP